LERKCNKNISFHKVCGDIEICQMKINNVNSSRDHETYSVVSCSMYDIFYTISLCNCFRNSLPSFFEWVTFNKLMEENYRLHNPWCNPYICKMKGDVVTGRKIPINTSQFYVIIYSFTSTKQHSINITQVWIVHKHFSTHSNYKHEPFKLCTDYLYACSFIIDGKKCKTCKEKL
jgi:hypothetical protein